ncbi:MAG TPA: acylphosphatase [Gemmatimonadaceae bacterium]|nr:acylphosphatase [Gemmatimonadaceae bacterium]
MTILHAVVRGQVQGVGFRWFVREYARERGLAGWVRNRSDGSVEVLASGEQTELQAFADALEQGPPGARVSGIDRFPNTVPEGELPDPFTIVR